MDAVPGSEGYFMGVGGGGQGGTMSHHRALGGGEVDGADANGQSFLQVEEDVGVDAGAGDGALGGGRFVQQLLEAVELDQQHHVLQEIALDESRKLRGTKELGVFVEVDAGFRGDILGADDLTVSLKGL